MGFGVALAILMAATDREPLVALGVLIVFAIFEVFFFGWVTLVDASLLDQLGWWKIIAANGLALIGMVAYEMRSPSRAVGQVAGTVGIAGARGR